MTYPQSLTASENPLGSLILRRSLLQQKTQALQKGILLPDDFIADVEEYVERNLIDVSIDGKTQKEFCPRCLKAYIFDAAEQHGLTQEAIALLHELFKSETLGHNGYYLDYGEVKPVRTV